MVTSVPAEITDPEGRIVRVGRAWPGKEGAIILEGRELETGLLRAGRLDRSGRVAVAPFAEDRALPTLVHGARSGELLVHRLKRRAVLRTGSCYVKYASVGKASGIARSHSAAAIRLAGTGWQVPGVVAQDAHRVTLSAVPGVGLHDLGLQTMQLDQSLVTAPPVRAMGALNMGWRAWAAQWPAFVHAWNATDSAVPPARHTAEDEARTVIKWTAQAASFNLLGVSSGRLDRAAEVVADLLTQGAPSQRPELLAHRDLHDKQILVDPAHGTIGIIDCDTLALAEPALDLANLAVHLDFRAAQGLLSAEAAGLGKRCIRDTADNLGVSDSRYRAYTMATALRLACVYAFRPAHRDTARSWFHRVEAGLRTKAA